MVASGGISGLMTVISALTQLQTNGKSLWGTLQAPTFPLFLTNNPLPNGYPWDNRTASGSNPYTQSPNTGVIRSYDFTLARAEIAPDGYNMSRIVINGQFPGPAIEANWGDTIQVTVHNQITGPEEGTSLHWHGLLQKESPWEDGVPSVQQCPIAPGSSFTYQFKADLYGTSWYHSHYSAQYADGAFGPLIIHGPSNAKYDIDLGPVLLTDYWHIDYFYMVQRTLQGIPVPVLPPFAVNNLINGKMNFNCSLVDPGDNSTCKNNAGISKFKFQTGKTHRLRLINAGAEGLQRFSIDGHQLTVIANDFVPVVPYTTNVVTLGVGQRADVLVTANQGSANSAFWMRSNISSACMVTLSQPYAVAAVFYDRANTTIAPNSTAWDVPDPGTCANDDLSVTIPYYNITPPTPSTTRHMDIGFFVNETGSGLWTFDDVTFRANYNSPLLLLASEGNFSYPDQWNVKNFGTNTTIRIIVYNPTPASHPMHLHGHNMYILHEGDGNWDGVSIIRSSNPQRRDTQMVRAGGHFVFQYDADNPGVWPFHCHVAWHAGEGLYANLMERPADIAKDYQIPLVMKQTCDNWANYSSTHVVDQIDSGV